MVRYFECLIRQWYMSNPQANISCECLIITQKELTCECRKIFDKMAIHITLSTFENRSIIDAVLKLPRLERIIIIFNVVGEFALIEIAQLLGSNLNSVYVQKHSALKKLRQAIECVKLEMNNVPGGG